MKNRPLVTAGKKVPPKIQALLDNPVYCSKVASVWPELREGMTSILMELPLHCKKEGLDASAVCLAANYIQTIFELLKDQAHFDRRNTKPSENEENPAQ